MSGGYVEAAAGIGRRLCAEAIWHEDRCTWVGVEKEEGPYGELVHRYLTLGPELYGGTAGVAHFLAHLWAATGEPAVRTAGLGAIRHALAHVDDMPPGSWAVYTGRGGVVLAALLVARLLDDEGVAERSRRLVEAAAVAAPDEHGGTDGHFDLMSGLAGAVLGLLALTEATDDDRLVDAATRHADALVARAVRRDGVCSWAPPADRHPAHLTGYSHGTAGAAHALLEMHARTGARIYRDVAEAAFAYERGQFDADRGNWADLRRRPGPPARPGPPRFVVYWCHGAPGIALSRLRAVELVGDETATKEAEVALETTRHAVTRWLDAGANWSLCHGLPGNAEVLAYGEDVLGPDTSTRALVARVAAAGIERYAGRGHRWPCGTQGGETPALFNGLAGIGLFYLRLADPGIPSVLVVRPESFRAEPNVRTAPTPRGRRPG